MATNIEIIKQTLCEIAKEDNWEDRYAKYAKNILKHEAHYIEMSKKARVAFPLSAYTTISRLQVNKCEYDIRYLGQSIGSLIITQDGKRIFKKSTSGYNDLLKRYPDLPRLQPEECWDSNAMSRFRSYLSKINIAEASTHSPEHKCENLLLREFSQTNSKKKSLLNIQPITFGGKFVQLTTTLTASKKGIVSYSKKGGGIDILARTRHKDNKVYICVMELKDQNKPTEPMSDVIQQALSYAVFIAKLLDSKGGDDWKKIFGYSGDVPPIIDVVGLMPMPKDKDAFVEEKYSVGNFTLQTSTLYYDQEALYNREKFEFEGSFPQQLMP